MFDYYRYQKNFPHVGPLKQSGPLSKATPKNGFNGVLRGVGKLFSDLGLRKRSSEFFGRELKFFRVPLKKFLDPPLIAWPNDSAERHQHVQSVMNIAASTGHPAKKGSRIDDFLF